MAPGCSSASMCRSATASAAQRACRCWCRNSNPRSGRVFPSDRPRPSRRCSSARISIRCRSTNSWQRWSPTDMSNAVDEEQWISLLDAGAHQIGLDLDPSQLGTLWRYAHMLRERNEHVNLTSIVTPEGILTLHMLDSLSVVPHLG